MRKLNIRRMVSAALAVLLVMSLTVGAFAVEDGDIPEDGIEATPEEETEGAPEGETEATPEVTPEEGTEAIPEEGTPEAGTETGLTDTGLTGEIAPAETTENDMTADVLTFSDVPEDHGFYTAIMDCAAKGITSGYADGTFRPTNSVTKAQFSVMLSRAFYPDEVKKYDTDVYKKQGWFVPNTRALYMAGVLKDTSFVSGFATSATMDQVINRYDMARLMTNIMANKGFSATSAQKTEAQKKIADYKNIPAKYQDAVKNVFALGIITGYSNGAFNGNNVMNRGQGCVVIYRMMKYTPATAPGGSGTGDTTYDDGKTPTTGTGNTGNTGNTDSTGSTTTQPETPAAKTLSNGKPVTEANVLALLDELKAKYPEGTSFAFGYKTPSKYVNMVAGRYSGLTGTNSKCGGWAALVSDYIFGKTDFPARQVSLTAARPGDIGLYLDANGKVKHLFIVTAHAQHHDDGEWTEIPCTDANKNGNNLIYWTGSQGQWDDGYGGTLNIWTRYPD